VRTVPARASLAVVASVAAVLLGACGVPRDVAGRDISSDEVPYRLLSPSAEPDEATDIVGPVVTTPSVYLVDSEDRLVAVPLTLDIGTTEAVAAQVLDDLQDGPSETQREDGLSSALGPGVRLELVEVEGSLARIDVSLVLRVPAADRLPLAVGEIVLSVTSVDGLDAVVLQQDGEPVETPLPGGARTTDPVTAGDYAELIAIGTVPPGP